MAQNNREPSLMQVILGLGLLMDVLRCRSGTDDGRLIQQEMFLME